MSTDICTTNSQPGVGKANFAFCVNNGLCKAKVGDNQPHPGCNCEEGFSGDHCEFLGDGGDGSSNSGSGSSLSSSGSDSNTSANVSTTESSDVVQANQSLIIAISCLLVAVIFVAGFSVIRKLRSVGSSASKSKTAAEAGAAVAEAENETEAGAGFATSDTASFGSGRQPFDENRQQSLPSVATPARFEEDDGTFEDVDDYSNDQSDASTLTEDDMSNVQIV